MSMIILLASSVGIGSSKESADGGGEISGEVGREEVRLIRRRLDPFLSFDEDVEERVGDVWPTPRRDEILAEDEDAVMAPAGFDVGATGCSKGREGVMKG